MLNGRKVNKIGLFELVADTRSELLQILLADFFLVFGMFKL